MFNCNSEYVCNQNARYKIAMDLPVVVSTVKIEVPMSFVFDKQYFLCLTFFSFCWVLLQDSRIVSDTMTTINTANINFKWDPKSLEIRTLAVERLLEPLVTQVRQIDFMIIWPDKKLALFYVGYHFYHTNLLMLTLKIQENKHLIRELFFFSFLLLLNYSCTCCRSPLW